MTDTPEPSSPTPFFAAEDDAVPGGYEEFQPAAEGQPLAPEPPRPQADPLNAPASPPPPAWPPPATEGAAQPELEQLLRDVRGALASLPGDDPEPAAPSDASAAAPLTPTPVAAPGPDLRGLRADVAGLQGAVGDLRDSQSLRHSELTARLDALAQSAADAVALAVATSSEPPTPPAGGPDGITMTDLHDGLAGVRTDVAALPDAIGPAVTSAVAHGLSETTRQVDGVSTALTETVAESGQLRAELASLQVTLASLHEQVSLLPQVLTSLRDVTDRMSGLEASQPPPPEPLPDIAGIVDDRLAEHLTAFGTGLGERLDSQLDAMHGLVAAPARDSETHDELVNDMGERLAETERRLAERLDVLRATDTSGQLARQLEGVEGRMHEQLTAAFAGDHDVADQLRAAELRITQHVDEAVLALAQAVLGGRAPATVPVERTESASEAATPTFEPVAFEPGPAAEEPVPSEAESASEPPEPEPVEPEPVEPEPVEPEPVEPEPVEPEPVEPEPVEPEPVEPEPVEPEPVEPEPVEPEPVEPEAVEPEAVEPESAEADAYKEPESGTAHEAIAVAPLEESDTEPAPAELDPVPAYGTDDLGLLPPAMAAADALHSEIAGDEHQPVSGDDHHAEDAADVSDAEHSEHADAEHADAAQVEDGEDGIGAAPEYAPLEAWAKGDAAYAEVDDSVPPVEAGDRARHEDDAEHEAEPAGAVASTGDEGEVGTDPTAQEMEHAGADLLNDDAAPDVEDGETPEPAYTLHTVGSPTDGDPERPELPPPGFDAAAAGITPDVLPEPDADAAPTRRGLFRRKR